MALWKDARVTYRGTNISTSVRAAAFEMGSKAEADSAMGDDDEQFAAGLNTWAAELELRWVAGSTSGIDSLFGSTAGRSGAFTIRATTGAVSAANPEYSGTAIRTNYSFGGQHGSVNVANVSLAAGSDLTRAIST